MFGVAMRWMSKRQVVITFFTMKSDYMETTHACKEAIWIKRLCSNIIFDGDNITIYCDNQSVIYLVKNPTFHVR